MKRSDERWITQLWCALKGKGGELEMGGRQVRDKISVVRNKRLTLLGVISILFLLTSSIALAASDDESPEKAPDSSLSAAPDESPGEELVGKRSATSRTFALPDGSRETRLYQSPVNYKDEHGDWQPIEESLTETEQGAITNGANQFDVTLPQDLDSDPMRFSVGEDWISQRPLGVETDTPELEGEEATYESQGSGASFQFTGLANGLKEDIELAGPDAPSTYRFEFTASEGLTPTLSEKGSIEVRDEDGKLIATLPAPIMSDSAPTPNVSSDVHYGLEAKQGGGWIVTVDADREWLSAPGRSWPARIDPTVLIPSSELDCDLASAPYAEYNFCGSSGWPYLGLYAKYKASGADEYARTLLRFNLSAIPATASITDATVGLYSPSTATNIYEVEVDRATKSWNSTVNWNRYATGLNWASGGGDYAVLNPNLGIYASTRGTQLGWWNFSSKRLVSVVQGWLTGEIPNQGLLFRLVEEKARVCSPTCIERVLEWSSSATAQKPYLSVNYIPAATPDSKVTLPKAGTRSAKRFKLQAAWDHAGVTGVTFQHKGPEGWIDIPASKVTNASGQALASWPLAIEGGVRQSPMLYWNAPEQSVPPSVLKGQIRAVLVSGTPNADGYTAPVDVELNRATGGPKDATTAVGPGTLDLLTGNLTIGRTDVAIPGFSSTFEFSRTYNSRDAKTEAKGILGQGWKSGAPVEDAGGAAWRSVREVTYTEVVQEEEEDEEGEIYITNTYNIDYTYAILTDLEGNEYAFEKESGVFVTPPEAAGWALAAEGPNQFSLTDPGGNRTVFSNFGTGKEYQPTGISKPGGPGNKTQLFYKSVGGKWRLNMIVAPAATGITCSEGSAKSTVGCHVLEFKYQTESAWGGNERLASIVYYSATGTLEMGNWSVAQYNYDSQGRLIEEWDPEVSPPLKEKYTYTSGGQVQTLTPPGQEPWTMEYGAISGEEADGRLMAVKRASLVASPSVAQTTIAYGVPVNGGVTGLEDMSPTQVAKWGQQDLPMDATAIFPADQIPSSPPSSYSRATVYYMDAEGQLSNTAMPSGAGTSALSITTSETDEFGNAVRELSAQNRLRVLALPTGEREKRWKELETKRLYSSDGTQLEEEWGPQHQVRLESGTVAQARLHNVFQYDEGWLGTGTKPHLVTRETSGASRPGVGTDADLRITETHYDWDLRQPIETIIDSGSGHLNIVSTTIYDKDSGLPIERRQPSNPGGGGAGSTKTIYYSGTSNATECKSKQYAGLPCKVTPAAQPGTAGLPNMLVRTYQTYSPLGAPTEVIESPAGEAGNQRRTVRTYDNAGRPLTMKIEGGGAPVNASEVKYSKTMGLPTLQQFACEPSCTGFDTQATIVGYDTLGRMTRYEDADGVESTITYDVNGRPVVVKDGKGSQTMTYDATSGLLTKLEDSGAGIFTAAYDADGNLVERTLPNGLTAKLSFNEVDDPTGLTYTKISSCGESCNWLSETQESSIYGQVLSSSSSLANNLYSYDKAGRLSTTAETPSGGQCTTRSYKYDKDSNRESLTTQSPGIGGACSWSGGTTQSYSYDKADRLLGTGLTYDAFGRITNLPAELAGGKALTTNYFSTSMVAVQSQGGVTNTYELDASLRQRQRIQGGGLEGIEVFHYSGPGDSLAWTQRGTNWTRSVVGIGGELVAMQNSGTGTTFQLVNLHGDVVATASPNPTETKLLGTTRFDEFGVPMMAGVSRYGWLGGKQRRTELASGVIQMGMRSYVPSIGRFLSTDPMLGGSANAYDYASADPVNGMDLDGMRAKHGGNAGISQRQVPSARPQRRTSVANRFAGGGGLSKRALRDANTNQHHLLPIVISCGCVSQTTVLEQAGNAVSQWTAPVRHWTADKAQDVASVVGGAAASIPCREVGIALGGTSVVVGMTGIFTVWIPGVGETLLLASGGIDLAGLAFDLSHEKGLC